MHFQIMPRSGKVAVISWKRQAPSGDFENFRAVTLGTYDSESLAKKKIASLAKKHGLEVDSMGWNAR